MSNWILVLSLFSAPDGNYVQVFKNEKACVQAMNTLINKTESDSNIKGIACVPNAIALSE